MTRRYVLHQESGSWSNPWRLFDLEPQTPVSLGQFSQSQLREIRDLLCEEFGLPQAEAAK